MKAADALTWSRILLAPALPVLAYLDMRLYMLVLFGLGLLTDILDGLLARRFKTATKNGHDLDIIADNIFAVSFMLALSISKPGIMRSYAPMILVVLTVSAVTQAISLLKMRKPVMARTALGRFTAVLFPIAFISAFYFGSGLFMHVYLAAMIISILVKFFDSTAHSISIPNALRIAIVIAALIGFFISGAMSKKICFETVCVDAEVKDTNEERMLGLMYRESLEQGKGMLFVFEQPDRYGFWMKNVKFPIDIIFVDKEKMIVHIATAAPCLEEPCDIYQPDQPALYVIEVNEGFSEEHDLAVGQRVII
jgi:uncharacterized protein